MPHDVALVDLYVFDTSSSLRTFLRKEYRKAEVVSSMSFSEKFFAMHDAWRGFPRIIVCLERIRELPKLCQIGGIRHEVGHSVLHGSPEFYVFPFPPSFLELSKQCKIAKNHLVDLLYLISIAVKDYEVSRLLYARNYVEDQVEYIKYLLSISEEDVALWEIAKIKPLAKALYLVSCLKTISCAAPFSIDQKFGNNIKRYIVDSLSHLPQDYSRILLKLVLESFSSFKIDTFGNIRYVSELVVENIIKPCFECIRNKNGTHVPIEYTIN
jgi:hypothetical protein